MTRHPIGDGPVTRSERAVLDALSAAMWSSTAADRMLTRLRPPDFHAPDDTIAAAILDLRQQQASWQEPTPVLDALHNYRQLWKDRHDAGKFGLPEMPVPIEDTINPDRVPLRFASRVLVTGRVYDVLRHIPQTNIDTATARVAADRRREVSAATMSTVRQILTHPPDGSTHDERQQAIGQVRRSYRRDMNATHLYPPGKQHSDRRPGLGR